MVKTMDKGEIFSVMPVNIEISEVKLTIFIGRGSEDGVHWINAIYYNNVSIKSDDPLFLIVSNMLKNKEIKG